MFEWVEKSSACVQDLRLLVDTKVCLDNTRVVAVSISTNAYLASSKGSAVVPSFLPAVAGSQWDFSVLQPGPSKMEWLSSDNF